MKTEKIFTLIFLGGLVFRALHWPGGGIISTISLMSIAILYFPAGFYFFCDKMISRQNLALSIISGFFLSYIPMGILFTIMHWPGAQIVLLVGMIAAPVFLVVTYILKNKATEDLTTYFNNMLLRISVLTILSIVFFLIPDSF